MRLDHPVLTRRLAARTEKSMSTGVMETNTVENTYEIKQYSHGFAVSINGLYWLQTDDLFPVTRVFATRSSARKAISRLRRRDRGESGALHR